MDIFLQQIINGLTLGSVYALVALGYTMVYGIIDLINFAHGEVVMIGAMVVAVGHHRRCSARTPPLPAVVIILAGLLVAILVCMAIAYSMEKIAYRPLRKRAAAGAADHRDRHVDHPAERRDDHLGPQLPDVPDADRSRRRTTSSARR